MGNLTNPEQMPYFMATLSTPTNTVTGDGTVFTCKWDTLAAGSGYDTSTGIFTAPMTGYYGFSVFIRATGLTSSHTLSIVQLITTQGTYSIDQLSLASYRSVSGNAARSSLVSIPMASGDTAYVAWQVSNGTKVVNFDSASRFRCLRFYSS